ncbi:MAG: hypothetical protein IPP96_13445 [Chitinophagaceae bacterium]|nr:hypothetical protein [Chitinophagaceae bacterium]
MSPYNCTNSEIKGVAASADSGYYVVIGDYELARLDKNGIILWTRRLNLGNLGPISVPYIITDSQSDVYTVTGAFNNGWTVTKVDKNGNLQWNRLFRLSYNPGSGPGPTEFAIPSGMHLLNDKLYVWEMRIVMSTLLISVLLPG